MFYANDNLAFQQFRFTVYATVVTIAYINNRIIEWPKFCNSLTIN